MLKTKSFSDIMVSISRLEDMLKEHIPSITFRKDFKQAGIELRFFEEKKLELEIRKSEEGITFGKKPETREEEQKFGMTDLTLEDIKNVGTDFDFIFGKICGILKIEELPNIEASLVFRKKQKIFPSKKLQILNENISAILPIPKTNIMGLNLDFFDDKKINHSLSFSQSEEEIKLIDEFKFKPSGPIVLLDILENSLEMVNKICSRLCEV